MAAEKVDRWVATEEPAAADQTEASRARGAGMQHTAEAVADIKTAALAAHMEAVAEADRKPEALAGLMVDKGAVRTARQPQAPIQ